MKLYTSDALGDHMKDPDGKTSSLTDRHEQTTHFCRGSVRGPRGPFCQHLRRPVFGKRRSCCKPCGVDSSFLTRKQSTPKTNCCKSAEESVWTAAEGKKPQVLAGSRGWGYRRSPSITRLVALWDKSVCFLAIRSEMLYCIISVEK